MKYKINSAKITGTPDAAGWSQVHDYTPQEPEKLKLRGRLFAVISTSESSTNTDTIVQGREVLSRLHEEYYGNLIPSAFEALKMATEKVVNEFKESKIEVAAASIVDGVVYTAVSNGAQAVLFRNNMLARILVGSDEVICASGYPEDNDVFVIATRSFFAKFGDGIIKASLETKDLEKISEAFVSSIHASQNSGNVAALVIAFEPHDKKLLELSDIEKKEEPKQVSTDKSLKLKNPLFLWLGKIGDMLPRRRLYIRRDLDEGEGVIRKKRSVLSAGLILILLLLISISFGIRQKTEKDKKLKYQDSLTQAIHDYEEANKLFDLDPVKARELFVNSKGLIANIEASGVKDKEVEALKKQIEENQGRILGEFSTDIKLFIDLSLVSSGFKAEKMVLAADNLAILDAGSKKMVSVDLDNKKTQVLAGPAELKNPQSVLVYSDRFFVYEEDGIYEVDEKFGKVIDRTWSSEAFALAYAGNIYVLDKTESKIFRFTGFEGGFADKKDWLAPGIEADFSNVTSIAIDGTIWVATSTGKILKFTQGTPTSVSVKGVSPPISLIDSIYTNENDKYVYVLDKLNSRMVILEKDGNFKGQYLNSDFAKVTSFGVVEPKKQAILLIEDKLYSFELKHL